MRGVNRSLSSAAPKLSSPTPQAQPHSPSYDLNHTRLVGGTVGAKSIDASRCKEGAGAALEPQALTGREEDEALLSLATRTHHCLAPPALDLERSHLDAKPPTA